MDKRFGGIAALTDVSFGVRPGEIRGLVGPNGAGKTSLLDIISGVQRPSSGHVLLDGEDVTSSPAVGRARRGLSRTFQRQQVFGWMTVEENVLAALDWPGGGGGTLADAVAWPARRRRERVRRDRARQALVECGLQDETTTVAGHLPIGKARMLELARAIAGEPSLLLLDEPNSGLGPADSDRLHQVIRRYRDAHGAGVVVVEHDMGFVHEVCDTVTVLALGSVIYDGDAVGMNADDAVRSAFLGSMAS